MRALFTVVISILSLERAFAEIMQFTFLTDFISFNKTLSLRDPGDLIVNSSIEIVYSVLKQSKIIAIIAGRHIADPMTKINNDSKANPQNSKMKYMTMNSNIDDMNILSTAER